jgi:hypothetical protein
MFIISLVKGKGYRSFLMTTFNFIKFNVHTNISFDIFLGTITIGDNQIAFSIGLMKLATNSLSMFYLTMAM